MGAAFTLCMGVHVTRHSELWLWVGNNKFTPDLSYPTGVQPLVSGDVC